MISAAGELKHVGQLKRILAAQFKQPEDEWVRFLIARVYDGSITQRVRDQFAPLVNKAMRQFLNEQVNDRLKNALGDPDAYEQSSGSTESADGSEPKSDRAALAGDVKRGGGDADVLTTEDELEGYRIVRAIVCSEVPATRIAARDTKTYFGVLLDDNNRKPVARLWFNRSKKYLGVFDENKVETRIPISGIEDIYRHADQLRSTVARYLANPVDTDTPPA